MPSPQARAMIRPIGVLPVKLTMSMSGELVRAAPAAAPEPPTMLTTPGGMPASSRSSPKRRMCSGSCGAGLTTTVLPIARAGAIFPARFTSGKLYGRDAGDDAYRLAHRDGPDQATSRQCRRTHRRRRQRNRVGQHGVAGIATEAVECDGHLHRRGHPHGGTGLGLEQRNDLLAALDQQIGYPLENLSAVSRSGARPAVEGLSGRPRSVQRLRLARLRSLSDDLLGRGIDDVVVATARLDPFTVKQQASRLHR